MNDSRLIGPPPERWIVVAFRRVKWKGIVYFDGVPMFPKHRDAFPICGSKQEARERAEIKKRTDPDFAARWHGWMFTQVPLDGVVEY